MSDDISNWRRTTEPHDELTEIAAKMLEVLPEGVQGIVLLNKSNQAGIGTDGFDDEREIAAALLLHVQAVMKSLGVDMKVLGI